MCHFRYDIVKDIILDLLLFKSIIKQENKRFLSKIVNSIV